MGRRAASFALFLVTLTLWLAPSRAEARSLELLTLGPDSYLYARFGHSALCVVEDDGATGSCFDFGVAGTARDSDAVWNTIVGEPGFRALKVPRGLFLETVRIQGRATWRQTIPATAEAIDRVAAKLAKMDADVALYTYHPRTTNCATKVRDFIDEATGGALSRDPAPLAGPTFRETMELHLAGHPLELAVVALTAGPALDRAPNSWEAGYLPSALRDQVAARLGAEPEQILQQKPFPIALQPAAGRGMLAALGIALAVALVATKKRPRAALTQTLTGLTLGGLATCVYLTAYLCAWPEVKLSLVFALLWPTDLLLGKLRGRTLERYATLRLASIALATTLSVTHAVAQPVVAVALLAALPLAALRFRRPSAVAAPSAAPTVAST